MKYEVSIEIKHDFPVDCKGLCKYAETLGLQMTMQTDKWISFSKEGELTPTESDFKSEEHKLLKEYHDALTEEGEATKLALPSRLGAESLRQWEESKKAEIAAITDFSTLTEAQKKLWMGLPLTDEEKNGLGV